MTLARSLGEEERERIYRDVASWETEGAIAGDQEPPTYDDVVDNLSDLDDDELIEYWEGTVGEWVLSRGDIIERQPKYDGLDGDEILRYELHRLIAGLPTTYGYLPGVSYREVDEPVQDESA